jgi:hypothetical protein
LPNAGEATATPCSEATVGTEGATAT